MMITRFRAWLSGLAMLSAGLLSVAAATQENGLMLPMASGPFQPTMDSLTNYHCPDWFRDAKFGIWSHWGPQAVPMAGDWYARHMYVQGQPQYKHHLENYGHPSTNGYKDIIPLWKAEQWDPDRLMGLYKRAGARYFVSMGVHHDNFDLWNSQYQRWNAVNMGPKRDVVGDWKKAAQKHGLRFGVSEHLGASFTWFQDSHRSDKSGPLAGLPYDGANPQYQDLYHFPADSKDTSWYSNNPRWHQMWYNRIKDLVDHYQLDLLYTDGGVPFGNEVGRSLIAHLYNSNLQSHDGRLEAVYACKQPSEGRWVEDLERGVMARVNPNPWQTDTSIGDWFYNKNWKFRPVSWVIHMLVDIVSKNGNLLLNVVQRPDGSLDPEVEQMLQQMAAWMTINSEGIYETRPWLVYGEGQTRTKGGAFKEDFAYSATDLRFTTKGRNTLYVFALGWPEDGRLRIRSLAKLPEASASVNGVSLLGYTGILKWSHQADALVVDLPSAKPCDYAISLKIDTSNVWDFKPELAIPAQTLLVVPEANGSYRLSPETAEMHGAVREEAQGGQPNLGFWDAPQDYVTWKVKFQRTGSYQVSVHYATTHPQSEFVIELAGQKLEGKPLQTGSWDKFIKLDLGTVDVKQSGEQIFTIRPKSPQTWKPINLRAIELLPQ